MTLSEETKRRIEEEYSEWLELQRGNLSKGDRKKPGAVYTPPEVTIRIIEKFECDSMAGKDIIDPACGSGNLLAACVIAGADPERIFGNEIEEDMVELCRARLVPLGVPETNIHRGDATEKYCLTHWGKGYKWPNLRGLLIPPLF